MPDIRIKDKLSNNRGNASQLGLWYVSAYRAPSTRHLRRLLAGDVSKLSVKGSRALASLYGFIKKRRFTHTKGNMED